MALQTNLRCVFAGSSDKKVSMTWAFANASAAANDVKALMTAIVANKEIFVEQPLSAIGAEFITRDVTEVNIS